MAVWQFTLDLISSSSARIADVDAIRMSREQLDVIRLEIPPDKLPALYGRLSELLSEKKSWSPGLRIWGDEKSHDVQVWSDGQAIESVQFRLDANKLSVPLMTGICDLARSLDCVFATTEGAIIQPTSEAMVREMMRSPAMQFVKDPEGFLEAAIRADRETT